MIVRGLTKEEIESAAIDAGVELRNFRASGRGFAFTLGLMGELWRRRSHTGRRINAVCYHGHAAFMQRIFNVNEDAILISAMARFDGVQAFKAYACGVGQRNVGSMVDPMSYNRACDCDGDLSDGALV